MAGLSQIEIGDFIPAYADFARRSSEIHCDLMIAPLRNNLFNNSKSSIKFFEYTSLGVPGIYGRVPPYKSVVTHGENGLLADSVEEWETALVRLIEDPQERYRLAQAATITLKNQGLLSENAYRWLEVYQQITHLPMRSNQPDFVEKTCRRGARLPTGCRSTGEFANNRGH